MRALLPLLLFWVGGWGGQAEAQPTITRWHETHRLMGSRFEFTALHADSALARQAVAAGLAEGQRIERLISSWDPNSQTSAINRQAGQQPVTVDRELWDLIYRAQKVSRLTQGAFDLSFASLDKVWRFDGSMTSVPDSATVALSVAKVDFRDIVLSAAGQTVWLREPGMKLGFGAIGKGYAANRAKAVMQGMGIDSGLVNAGGDLICWGEDRHGPWRIAIADPQNRTEPLAWLELQDVAVVSSGDYERFALINGKRYSHIIDPRTGWPAKGLRSATIVCPDAELADALATSVMVLGPEKGLALIDQLNGIEALLVTEEGKLLSSQHLAVEWVKETNGQK